jgi:ABC-type sugar transport system ATPase subunit
MTGAPPAVALGVRGVRKAYPGGYALDGLDLDVAPGEIHGLVGGNGSGKSTLLRVLAGVTRADAGTVATPRGHRPVARWSPRLAAAAGLRFVHQDPGLFDPLSVAENLALATGFPTGPLGRIRRRALHEAAAQALRGYGLAVPPATPVGRLAPGPRTWVAVIRAVRSLDPAGGGVLCLDEPTAALPAADVRRLHAELRRCAGAGHAVVYVSHRLDEVLALADRVSVLRDGRLVTTAAAARLTGDALVTLMSGRTPVPAAPGSGPGQPGEVVLECAGLAGGPLRGVDLRVRRGEVLGVAGRLGCGRSTLLRMLFGAYPVAAGEIRLAGRPVRWRSPRQAMRAGVAYVPEQREAEGIFPGLSIRYNLVAAGPMGGAGPQPAPGPGELDTGGPDAGELDAGGVDERAAVDTLSGGNQQKVLLARWLRRRPPLLLLDEPTRGVDAATRTAIHARIRRAAGEGAAVVVVAGDRAELDRVCDRVVVLSDGRIEAGHVAAAHR